MKTHTDEYWMHCALKEAQKAFDEDEIPVGAVIVKDEKIISKAHNQTELKGTSIAHAEMLALEKARKKVGKWLHGCTLYVTLEPCSMCAGALVLSRIDTVIFGAFDAKNGAVGSLYNILYDTRLNHNPRVITGVLQNECSQILKKFFQSKR